MFRSIFPAPFSRPFPAVVTTAAAGWWLAGGISSANAIAAYAPKGAASQAASYTNLANPGTYNAAPGTAPGWDTATGWQFTAASTHFLTTGISVDGGSFSVIVRFSNAVATTAGRLVGTSLAANANPRLLIIPINVTSRTYSNGSGASNVAGQLTSGVMGVAGNKAYLNGSDEGVTLTAWSGTNTNGIYIGAQNNNGSASSPVTAYIQALAVYNTAITAPQVAALTIAMNAL